jgi:hypothetical protein
LSFLSDLFDGANKAAAAQTAGIDTGQNEATSWINSGNNILAESTLQGLQPNQQNYATAQTGVSQLGNVLGLNGPAGSQAAMSTLQSTPGYQFQLQQGDNAVNAQAAANGTTGSGNQQLALSNYNQGLAGTTYGNYVSQLQPYLGASSSAASGIGSLYENQGNVSNQNFQDLANISMGAQASIGNANASADLANQGLGLSLVGGLLGLGSSGLTSGLSSLGGTAGTSLGSLALGIPAGQSLFPGGVASDERLKENISRVGELFDGTNVYRYNYKWDDVPHIGLMAHEIEQRFPEAVGDIGGGYKGVHYGRATEFASELGKFLEAA